MRTFAIAVESWLSSVKTSNDKPVDFVPTAATVYARPGLTERVCEVAAGLAPLPIRATWNL